MYDVLLGVTLVIIGIIIGIVFYSICTTLSEQKKVAKDIKKDLEALKEGTKQLESLKAEIDAYNDIQKKEVEETEEEAKKYIDSTVEVYDNVTKILGGINVNK